VVTSSPRHVSSSRHRSVATAESVGDCTPHRTQTFGRISQQIAFGEGAADRGQADQQNGRHHQEQEESPHPDEGTPRIGTFDPTTPQFLTSDLATMKFSFQRRTDLALSALRQLAMSEDSVSGSDLADALDTTVTFLPQVMSPLVKAGWVESGRGPGGGYRLSERANDVSLLDVVERIEGPPDNGRCILRDDECPGEQACQMHAVWTEVRELLVEGLRSIPATTQPGERP
jgi:Rrf2 family transcriptional regulator, iron-sulfur cluster assembly transcription factor